MQNGNEQLIATKLASGIETLYATGLKIRRVP